MLILENVVSHTCFFLFVKLWASSLGSYFHATRGNVSWSNGRSVFLRTKSAFERGWSLEIEKSSVFSNMCFNSFLVNVSVIQTRDQKQNLYITRKIFDKIIVYFFFLFVVAVFASVKPITPSSQCSKNQDAGKINTQRPK